MATARCLLVFCVLTWVHCMARLDAKSLGASTYTDCLPNTNSSLTISAVSLSNTSPYPTDQINLSFNVANPAAATESVAVGYILWTVILPTNITVNQSTSALAAFAPGANETLNGTDFQLNQFYSSGSVTYQLGFFTNSSFQAACWTGSVALTAPTRQFDCLGGSLLNLSAVVLHPSVPVYQQPFNFTFEVENNGAANVSFTNIDWTATFTSANSINYNQGLKGTVTVANGAVAELAGANQTLNQNVTVTSYFYQFQFLNSGANVACWEGYQSVTSSSSYLYFLGLAGLSFLFMS